MRLLVFLFFSGVCFAQNCPIAAINATVWPDFFAIQLKNVSSTVVKKVTFRVILIDDSRNESELQGPWVWTKKLKPGEKRTGYWKHEYGRSMWARAAILKVVFDNGETQECGESSSPKLGNNVGASKRLPVGTQR